jgi:hypothetical protein
MPTKDANASAKSSESLIDKLLDKAKSALASSIDKGTPSVMKGDTRLRSYDDVVNEAVRGRQSSDSSN